MDIRKHTPEDRSGSYPEQGRPERIKEYIRNNLSTDLSAAAVAEKFGLSVSSLLHVFKRYEQLTYQHYLENTRMQAAFDLIVNRGRRVKEAMYATGYKNRTTFNNAFKKAFKYPPCYFGK